MIMLRSVIWLVLIVLSLSSAAQGSIHQELRGTTQPHVNAKPDLRAVASLHRQDLPQPEILTSSIGLDPNLLTGEVDDPLAQLVFPPALAFLFAAMTGLIALRRMSTVSQWDV